MDFMGAKDQGRICIFGAPFDSTTSFSPGTRFGPGALRDASYGLETFSPVFESDLGDVSFMDDEDLELPFGDPSPALEMIERKTGEILSSGRLPVMLGGEHLVSLGAVKAVHEHFENMLVVHLDAHADLRDHYLGQKLSHATVMRRVLEVTGSDSLRQIGIRSCAREEYETVRQVRSTPGDIVKWASDRPCYISCDLDVLDPSIFPGTGTPEPEGMSFTELRDTLSALINGVNVVGMDFVELCPRQDLSGVSAIVAAKIVRESLLALGNLTEESR